MASLITPAGMRRTVYKVGGYFEADGTTLAPFDNSGIRASNSPKALNGGPKKPADVNQPFRLGSNPALSFSLQAEGTKVLNGDTKVLNFRPPGVTDTNKIIYLPFYEKNITSTVVPIADASVCYFTTDAMSGCNFFIDQLPNGDLVCHHANALNSPTDTQTTMETQHRTAMQNFPVPVTGTSLRVADYYAKAQALVDQKVKDGGTNVKFYGGTTILGFHGAGMWEFWFQTYGQLTYTISSFTNLMMGKGKSKDVKVGDAPQEIIDVQRFWPK